MLIGRGRLVAKVITELPLVLAQWKKTNPLLDAGDHKTTILQLAVDQSIQQHYMRLHKRLSVVTRTHSGVYFLFVDNISARDTSEIVILMLVFVYYRVPCICLFYESVK
jgi:hypothetical protein